jgi:N-acetylglucosamine malate deacetylase 1
MRRTLNHARWVWSKLRDKLGFAESAQARDTKLWQQVAELKEAAAVLDLARRRAVFRPKERAAPSRSRIVVVAPHPDDELIGPGGTLLLARDAGSQIRVVYVTSEGFSSAEQRKAEARESCRRLGCEAIFLPLVPGSIPMTAAAADQLFEAIDGFTPDIVFLPFFLDDHDDHRRTLQLLLLGANLPKRSCAFTVWAYQVYSAAALPAVVDITKVETVKRQAIAGYASEMEKRDWAHYALGQNAAASRFLPTGPEPRFAELFYIDDFTGYAGLLARYFRDGPNYHTSYQSDER